MAWWEQNKLRMIQTNLRDTDAVMDVDLLIAQLKALSANSLQFNTGGIVAFYPTELKYHYKNPYLTHDLLREVIDKCHQNGMKFIARFDFSKAHESVFKEKPEWFYRSPQGEAVNYNGMVHTCINGFYQNEYSLEIIREVLTKYPVDGIFFNMFGYQTTDYSGNYHGICHCDNCKKKFMEMYHLELPSAEDRNDPVYQKYLEFKNVTTRQLLDKIHKLVKSMDEELPISTYNDYKVDIIRKESNTAVDRPYPVWLYSASENVMSVEDTWDDKIISNCSINAVDIPYRFMGVSKHLIRTRLYESIASGSGLDFCINGVVEDYPDRDNFDAVKEVFEYHKRNEKYYGCFRSVSDIALLKPAVKSAGNGKAEYLGIFKILKEQHILFDVICQENLKNRLKDLNRYRCVIVPDCRILSDEEIVKAIGESETKWILTGQFPENENSVIYPVTGGKLNGFTTCNRGAYFLTKNKEIFRRFPNRDWLFLDRSFARIEFPKDQPVFLPFMESARFGPPERCGGYAVSEYFGAGVNRYEKATVLSIPWEVGTLYQKYGYEDHKNLLLDLLDYMTESRYTVVTDAPLDVELFLGQYEDGSCILQILNVSGYNGSTFYQPNPLFDFNITVQGLKRCSRIRPLDGAETVEYEKEADRMVIHIRRLDSFQAFIIS